MELFREHYSDDRLRAIPTLTLAHIGDAVYELLARSAVADEGGCRVEDAHKRTVAMVSAPAQAKAMGLLLPLLDEWENAAFRRGRNVHLHSIPKHCTAREYAYATGLEALFGALYLAGKTDRVQELWEKAQEAQA